jgi:hypothetical protein
MGAWRATVSQVHIIAGVLTVAIVTAIIVKIYKKEKANNHNG